MLILQQKYFNIKCENYVRNPWNLQLAKNIFNSKAESIIYYFADFDSSYVKIYRLAGGKVDSVIATDMQKVRSDLKKINIMGLSSTEASCFGDCEQYYAIINYHIHKAIFFEEPETQKNKNYLQFVRFFESFFKDSM